MNGWDIVQVIVVLVGLLGGVMGPVLRLNSSMTKLNTTLNNVDERLKKQEEHLWVLLARGYMSSIGLSPGRAVPPHPDA